VPTGMALLAAILLVVGFRPTPALNEKAQGVRPE
jgi:hypothetical protein